MVLKHKLDKHGPTGHYRAFLVADGYIQKKGIDYYNTLPRLTGLICSYCSPNVCSHRLARSHWECWRFFEKCLRGWPFASVAMKRDTNSKPASTDWSIHPVSGTRSCRGRWTALDSSSRSFAEKSLTTRETSLTLSFWSTLVTWGF